VTLVTTRLGQELLGGLPGIGELLVFEKSWSLAGQRSFWGLCARLFRGRFDVAVAAQRSTRTGQLVWVSRAPLRIGFAGAPGAWAYGRRVAWDARKHAVERYLDLATPAGGDPSSADRAPGLAVDPQARTRIDGLLREHGVSERAPLLCVAPGSARATKRWTAEGYARVVRAAASRGLAPVLAGAPQERDLCAAIAATSATRVATVAGRTGVRDLVALIQRSSALVCNDSGPAHVASAVGTPVVSIFGPSAPSYGYAAFGRLTRVVEHPGLACRPCSPRGPHVCPLGHFRCMRGIEPSQVLRALDELLGLAHGVADRPAPYGDDPAGPSRRCGVARPG
jgi:heptosyltransferase-2